MDVFKNAGLLSSISAIMIVTVVSAVVLPYCG